jgi:competence protein ComEA
MKRFAATVGAVAFAVTALASGAGAQGTTAPAKTDPKPEVKTETKAETKGAVTTPAPAKSTTATPATPAAPAKAADGKPMAKVDINTASAADLTAAGFTEDEAKKIVDGRPWKSKDELVKKKAVSEQSYKKVKNGIVAHQMKAEAKKTK